MPATNRLLAALIAGLLFSGIGGLVLTDGAAEATDDNPISALALTARAPTVRADQDFRKLAVPTTAPRGSVTATPLNPIAPPKQARQAGVPIVQIGTIEIPKIGLVHPIFEGITLTVIDHGPSHWPGTAMPGTLGNAVFAGHRVTKTRPFRNIDQLGSGDQVIFTVGGTRSVYEFVRSEIVTPKGLHIVEQTHEPTATIFACHPPGSARYRYVVHLKLVQG